MFYPLLRFHLLEGCVILRRNIASEIPMIIRSSGDFYDKHRHRKLLRLRLSQTRVYANTVTTQSKLCDTIEITVIFIFLKLNLEPELKWNFSREITNGKQWNSTEPPRFRDFSTCFEFFSWKDWNRNQNVFSRFFDVLNFSREIELENSEPLLNHRVFTNFFSVFIFIFLSISGDLI